MKVHYRSRALADLEEIFQYIDKRNPSGARKVVNAIYAAIAHIAKYPLAAERTSHSDTYFKVVSQYPYKNFYQVRSDHVEILHVRHGARGPWIRGG